MATVNPFVPLGVARTPGGTVTTAGTRELSPDVAPRMAAVRLRADGGRDAAYGDAGVVDIAFDAPSTARRRGAAVR